MSGGRSHVVRHPLWTSAGPIATCRCHYGQLLTSTSQGRAR